MKTETPPIERTKMFWAANEDSWHTPETVCAVTELSPNTLQNWRAQGQGPVFFKSGKLVFYRKKDILNWFQSFQPSQSLAA